MYMNENLHERFPLPLRSHSTQSTPFPLPVHKILKSKLRAVVVFRRTPWICNTPTMQILLQMLDFAKRLAKSQDIGRGRLFCVMSS